MIIICGASASGKTAVLKHLVSTFHYTKMITTTTRPKRLGEEDHKDYFFISEEAFLKLKEEDGFIETTKYNGYWYGTQKAKIKSRQAVILDPDGVNQFYQKRRHQDFIVYFSTPQDIRKSRMEKRLDSSKKIQERLSKDDEIFDPKNLLHIDLMIENDTRTIEEIALEIHTQYRRFKIYEI